MEVIMGILFLLVAMFLAVTICITVVVVIASIREGIEKFFTWLWGKR